MSRLEGATGKISPSLEEQKNCADYPNRNTRARVVASPHIERECNRDICRPTSSPSAAGNSEHKRNAAVAQGSKSIESGGFPVSPDNRTTDEIFYQKRRRLGSPSKAGGGGVYNATTSGDAGASPLGAGIVGRGDGGDRHGEFIASHDRKNSARISENGEESGGLREGMCAAAAEQDHSLEEPDELVR